MKKLWIVKIVLGVILITSCEDNYIHKVERPSIEKMLMYNDDDGSYDLILSESNLAQLISFCTTCETDYDKEIFKIKQIAEAIVKLNKAQNLNKRNECDPYELLAYATVSINNVSYTNTKYGCASGSFSATSLKRSSNFPSNTQVQAFIWDGYVLRAGDNSATLIPSGFSCSGNDEIARAQAIWQNNSGSVYELFLCDD